MKKKVPSTVGAVAAGIEAAWRIGARATGRAADASADASCSGTGSAGGWVLPGASMSTRREAWSCLEVCLRAADTVGEGPCGWGEEGKASEEDLKRSSCNSRAAVPQRAVQRVPLFFGGAWVGGKSIALRIHQQVRRLAGVEIGQGPIVHPAPCWPPHPAPRGMRNQAGQENGERRPTNICSQLGCVVLIPFAKVHSHLRNALAA